MIKDLSGPLLERRTQLCFYCNAELASTLITFQNLCFCDLCIHSFVENENANKIMEKTLFLKGAMG